MVTVCVPTIGRAGYLTEALRSVARQTYTDWELLVGENSGDPAYARMVDDLVTSAPLSGHRISVVHHRNRLSMSENANALFAAARTRYVLYLPDDDRLRPDCLATLIQMVADDPGVDIAFSDHWVIREDGTIDESTTERTTAQYGRARLSSGAIPAADLLGLALRQSFTLQTMLIRRELLGPEPFRKDRAAIPDIDLPLRLASRHIPPRVTYSPARLVEYRVHGSQFSANPPLQQRVDVHSEYVAALGECEPVPPRHRRLHRRRVAEHQLALANCYARQRLRGSWLAAWRSAVSADPWWPRPYISALVGFVPWSWLPAISRASRLIGQRKRP